MGSGSIASKGVRWLYLLVGLGAVGMGYVGVVVPGMPATFFFLAALWAFKRSSPRFETWLLTRSPARGFLQDWDRERSMTVRNKVVALVFLWASIAVSVAILVVGRRAAWVPPMVVAAGVIGTIVILRVKVASRRG